jgi:hypothetical protein
MQKVIIGVLVIVLATCVIGMLVTTHLLDESYYTRPEYASLEPIGFGMTSLGLALVAFGCVLALGRLAPHSGKKDE